jgi:small subunit ribosomal protein S8
MVVVNDPIGDLLTRIRNGQSANLAAVRAPASKLRANVLDVLKREGYIRDYSVSKKDNGTAEFSVELKYSEGRPVINEIARVSKPGRRVYSKINDVPKVYNGLGISILSTPRGVMSDKEARTANVGGEILCRVF